LASVEEEGTFSGLKKPNKTGRLLTGLLVPFEGV